MSTSPTAPPTKDKPKRPLGRRLGRALSLLVLCGVLLFVAFLWLMVRFSYSTGERAGYVQKFSRKGWLCKTWEGELAMANLPGAMPEVFAFTVWDDAVAAQVNTLMGQRVVLHYQEKVGLPTSCFGDTRHFVNGVRPVASP